MEYLPQTTEKSVTKRIKLEIVLLATNLGGRVAEPMCGWLFNSTAIALPTKWLAK